MLLMYVINIVINMFVALIQVQSPHLGVVLDRIPEEEKMVLKTDLF